MAKVNYERINKTNFVPLEKVTTGDVIKWENDIYIVTGSYDFAKGESKTYYRALMSITNYNFGEVEYVNEKAEVEILENAEITIKY